MKLMLALSAVAAPLALAGNGDGLVMGLIRSALMIDNGKRMCMRSLKAPNEVGFASDPVGMAECDENDLDQMWAYDKVTGGIWSVANGKRIDNAGGRKVINNLIQLWPRRRTDENKHDGSELDNMQWDYDSASQTHVLSLRLFQELAIDWNFAEDGGRGLRTYKIHRGENQRWEFVEVSLVKANPFQIVSRDRSRGVMCVAAQSRSNGKALQVQPCDGRNPMQLWSRNLNSGAIWINQRKGDWQLIDVAMGNTKIGNRIQTWGSTKDPHTSVNRNRNMVFDYCPLTGQIRWRANNDRVLRWNQHSDEIEFGASWDLPQPVDNLPISQQFDFVAQDPASLIAPEPFVG